MSANIAQAKINKSKIELGIISTFVFGIIATIIVPLPEWLTDLAIGTNIAISLIILFTAMSSSEPLDFSSFPSLLMITTLFRLSLNIASTKLILQFGHAGKMIEAFGTFVIGGNIVVGFIVFLIIMIVQFMVITKGAERISEIAARFTLDAMPGKQMAIDAELTQGLINETEARDRRKKIQAEADFFGSMDGATKFVKGDAIAALIIAGINIIAGFALGMIRDGLPFSESLSTYTMLTVGEGLVSSIPSLLISVATGVMVARSFAGDNMGTEVMGQLFVKPQVLFISSLVCLALALIPGINKIVFLLLALILFLLSNYMKKELEKQAQQQEETKEELLQETKEEDYATYFNPDPLEIEVGYGLVNLATQDFQDKVDIIRKKLANEIGFLIPGIRIRDNINLDRYEYVIKINALEIDRYTLHADKLLVFSQIEEFIDIEGEDTIDPSFGFNGKWVDKKYMKVARNNGYVVADALDVMSVHFEKIVKDHSHEILDREMTKTLIDYAKQTSPTIVEELVPSVLTVGQVQQVLCNLLREQVAINNLGTILEVLADRAESCGKDSAVMTDYVRIRLSKQIVASLDQSGNDIHYISFTETTEEKIKGSIQQNALHTVFLKLPDKDVESFLNQLTNYCSKILELGKVPVIMCSPIVRFYLNRYIESRLPFIKVFSHDELASAQVELCNEGVISLEE